MLWERIAIVCLSNVVLRERAVMRWCGSEYGIRTQIIRSTPTVIAAEIVLAMLMGAVQIAAPGAKHTVCMAHRVQLLLGRRP